VDDLDPQVRRQLKQAAQAIRKQFAACRDFGLHENEFWYWLIAQVDPRGRANPRIERDVVAVKRRRAQKARNQRAAKNAVRNREIRERYEVSMKNGEAASFFYRNMSSMYGLQVRQLQKIVRGK
jgi:hypothetical protein